MKDVGMAGLWCVEEEMRPAFELDACVLGIRMVEFWMGIWVWRMFHGVVALKRRRRQ